jgi:predicted enzyme related to lactoylglutathione lyase
MASTPELGFLILYVSDLEESLKYFTETVGLEHDPRQDTPNFRGFVHAGSVGFGLALVDEEISPESRQPGTIEIYFDTNNLDGMHAELESRGAQPTKIAHRPFGSIFSIPAPDGHLVTMLRPPTR